MKETIELLINQMHKLYVHTGTLDPIKEEVELFLDQTKMNHLDFAKRVMFTEEIKTNNLVEGYNDDLSIIDEVVKNNQKKKIGHDEIEQRILNLYNGYKYILKGEEINKDNLKKLYRILSRQLLDSDDLANMGEYYRNAPVYIYYSSNIDRLPDEGINHQELDKYMDHLFEYINQDNELNTMTDYYLKSQIMHFYFVFIHPYFDVNGRTSRTMSMWYLLNKQIYPFIIFNRGITYDKSTYYQAIMETKKFGNITIFLKYMLENVKVELEKEYLVMGIEDMASELSIQERQAINYILAMNGEKTLKDFGYFYRRFNKYRTLVDINENIIEPLIDKNILEVTRYTKSKIYDGSPNFVFKINESYLDNDPAKIKRIKL